jgi:hypothetical protein
VEHGVSLNNYRYAVLSYVHTSDPELKKRIVRWTLNTKAGLDDFLDRLLEDKDESSDEELSLSDDSDPGVRRAEAASSASGSESLATTVTSSVESTRESNTPREVPKPQENSRSKTASGLTGKVRSLLWSVFHEEEPPSFPIEESTSTPPVKKDDS